MKRANFGFTVIEILITLIVIGGIAAIVMINYPSATKKARDVQRMNDLKSYQTALEFWANKNGGVYPTSAPVDIANLCTDLGMSSSGCPKDPKGGTYSYETDSGGLKYTIYSQQEQTSENYVVCSNGKSGDTATTPSGGVCPTF